VLINQKVTGYVKMVYIKVTQKAEMSTCGEHSRPYYVFITWTYNKC